MAEFHTVTPEEAQEMLNGEGVWQRPDDMAATIAAEPARLLAARAAGWDEGYRACLRQWDPEHRPNADRAPERNPHAAALLDADRDPAEYGYPPHGMDLAPAEPHEVRCRACGRMADEHTPGRYSVHGVCPPEDRRDARRWLGHAPDGPGPTCRGCGLPSVHHAARPEAAPGA